MEVNPRNCRGCGEPIERKPKESPSSFKRRTCCDAACKHLMTGKLKTKAFVRDESTLHWRARKLKAPGPCEECGNPKARDVHHKDKNPRNNSPDNLERLCSICHAGRHKRIKSQCRICIKMPVHGGGYCSKHYQRFRVYGDPLAPRNYAKHRPGKTVQNVETGELFQSIGEAAAKYKIERGCISIAIKLGRRSRGFHWRLT